MSVAKTIRDQIVTLDRSALMAWGAKDLTTTGCGFGLRFKTSGLVTWKGYVTITLNANDLYDIEFTRVRKTKVIVDSRVEDIFADMMVKTIDEVVG